MTGHSCLPVKLYLQNKCPDLTCGLQFTSLSTIYQLFPFQLMFFLLTSYLTNLYLPPDPGNIFDTQMFLDIQKHYCFHVHIQISNLTGISFLCNTKIGVQLLFLFFIQIANRSKNIYLKDCSEHHICPRLNIHKCVSLFLGSQFCSIGLFACA